MSSVTLQRSLIHFWIWISLISSSPRTSSKDFQTFNENQRIIFNSGSSISIGVLLPVSASKVGNTCGSLTGYGILQYEALRWGLKRINKIWGQIGKRVVHNSLIPGVEIGLLIYDTCGSRNQGLTALKTLFPDLRNESTPSRDIEGGHYIPSLSLGVLDLTGDEEIVQTMMEANEIPFVSADFSTFDSVKERAKAVLGSASKMGWGNISLVLDQLVSSLQLAKSITRQARSEICVIRHLQLRETNRTFTDVTADPAFNSFEEMVKESDVVVMIASGQETLRRIFRIYDSLHQTAAPAAALLLAKSLSEPAMTSLRSLILHKSDNSSRHGTTMKLFQLSFTPSSVPEFDLRWKDYQNNNFYETTETRLVTSYLEQVKNCSRFPSQPLSTKTSARKNPCTSLRLTKDQELMPTASSAPFFAALHALFTFINAIKEAWRKKCLSRKGVCSELLEMKASEFRDTFLVPLEFQHSDPGSRSPEALMGYKSSSDSPGTLRGMRYGLFKVDFEASNLAVEVLELAGNISVVKSPRIFEDHRNYKQRKKSAEEKCPRALTQRLFKGRGGYPEWSILMDEPDEKMIFKPSTDGIYMAALFPVHFPSENGTGCSLRVNPEGLQEVESFLWAVDQIKLHSKLLPSTNPGILVLDTCGSKIRAISQVTSLMKNSRTNLKIGEILAFVTSLEARAAEIVGNLLASMNITSINLGRSGAHSPFALQMASSVNEQAKAIIQILSFLGWSYVSVVVSENDLESRSGANAFRTIGKAMGICVAMEMKILATNPDPNSIKIQLKELIRASQRGARGVIVFLIEEDLSLLLLSLAEAEEEGLYEKGQLSFFGSTTWGDNLAKLRNFGAIMAGAVVLRDGQKDVDRFTIGYQLLTPKDNTQNPWFKEFWIQQFGCKDPDCVRTTTSPATPPVIPYYGTPSSSRVIQSVFSFGAAVTQMLNYVCPHAEGRMCPRLSRWRRRILFNEFLRNTEVTRADAPLQYFQFSENFHGNPHFEVLSLEQREDSEEAEFKKVGRYINSNLIMFNQTLQVVWNGSTIAHNSLDSSCFSNCRMCQDVEGNYVFVPSPQKVYIMVTFDIHERGATPIECGSLRSDQGIQNTEAFLWMLHAINQKSKVKIGAIILDSCQSRERIISEVTNFLTGRIPAALRNQIHSQRNVIGVISGNRGEVMQQLLNIVQPYNLTTIATQAQHSFLKNRDRYPHLLTLSPTNDIIANALISLAELWNWELVSVVYSDFGDTQDIVRLFVQKSTSASQLKLSTFQPIQKNIKSANFMLNVWSRVAQGAQDGSRVVFLLLEEPHDRLFFQMGSQLLDEDLLKPGDFLFVMTKTTSDPFVRKEEQVRLGGLLLVPLNGFLEEFASHFEGLSAASHNYPYKWFREFWSKLYKCKGRKCFEMKEETIRNRYEYRQSRGVVETLNALLLLKETWKIFEQVSCGESANNSCVEAVFNSSFKQDFFDAARSQKLKGVDQVFVQFTANGNNQNAMLQILNYRIPKSNQSTVVRVGTYDNEKGLSINSSQMFIYDEKFSPLPLLKIVSKCIDFLACGGHNKLINMTNTSSKESPDNSPNTKEYSTALTREAPRYQEMYPFQRFGLSILVPLHAEGEDIFSCGVFSSEMIFQNVAAVAYALSKINANDLGLGLGAVVFDFCSRIEKAREQYFSFFSGKLQQNRDISMTKDRIVASISFDDSAAQAVSSILSSNHIPQFSFPLTNREFRYKLNTTILSSVPTRSSEIRLLVSMLEIFSWKYISVIYDSHLAGNILLEKFRAFSRDNDICIGDSLAVPKRISKEYASEVTATLSGFWKPTVIVLLMDDSDNIRTLLEVFDEHKLAEKFTFLSGMAWGNKMAVTKGLERIAAGALTFTLESYDLPDFRSFIANLSLNNPNPISREWYEDYFQHKYECKLSESHQPANQYENECSKAETTHPDDIIQDPYVFHTILGVNSVAHGLDSYIRKRCSNVETVNQCKIIQAELLLEILEQGELRINNETTYGYHVWNFRKIGEEYGFIKIGNFKNGKIKLEKSKIEFKIGAYAPQSLCIQGKCLEICSLQSPVYAVLSIPEPLPLDHNFKSVYGIVVSSLSLLGIIGIVVILMYFMVTFPNAEGSSILGHFILIGCLMIFSVNFAFIFQPTIGTCTLRRFLMGFAYSIVFSAMLMKIIQSWRLEEEERYGSRECGVILICATLILVEIILTAAWLIICPPKVDFLGEMWRCAPSENFEKELVISLVYVMLLIAATLLFCCETWQYRDRMKQTRWILVASSITAFTWVIWTVVATQAPLPFRDPAIVIGNLVSAFTILLFLYAQKFYIYSYLREDLKDLEMRSQFSSGFGIPVLSRTRSFENEFAKNTNNPIQENRPGVQFVGVPEVSFRTVTLPPNRPVLHPSTTRTSHLSRYSSNSRPSFEFSFEDDLPTTLNFNVLYESSEEEFPSTEIPGSDREDGDSARTIAGDSIDYSIEKEEALPTTILSGRPSNTQRLGSNPTLVFLADGSAIGKETTVISLIRRDKGTSENVCKVYSFE